MLHRNTTHGGSAEAQSAKAENTTKSLPCRQAGKILNPKPSSFLGFGNWDLFGSIGNIGIWDLS